MGGPGSGTWTRIDAKTTCNDCLEISVVSLARKRMLEPGTVSTISWSSPLRGENYASIGLRVTSDEINRVLRLDYRYDSEDTAIPIWLQKTHPHFGGVRWWLTCPLITDGVPCNRRVGKLYLRGRYFGCRHCHDLTYDSCQESHTRYAEHFRKLRGRNRLNEYLRSIGAGID